MVAGYRGSDKSCGPKGRRFRYVWEQPYDDSFQDYPTRMIPAFPNQNAAMWGSLRFGGWFGRFFTVSYCSTEIQSGIIRLR